MPRRLLVLTAVVCCALLAACAAGPQPAAPSPSTPAAAASALTDAPVPTEAPAPTEDRASSAGRLAWPEPLPAGQQIQAERSSVAADLLQLELASPADAQDTLTIRSAPDSGAGFGGPCRQTLRVRGLPGVVCSTGAGATVQWVEQGWRYAVGGGLVTPERAVAIAETLEFVDLATARQRLGR